MPVRVDDRDDGALAVARERENGVAVPVVPARVDHHEPFRRVEDHRVAVGPAPREDRATQELDPGRKPFRLRRRRQLRGRARGVCQDHGQH
jgi:hypothetical protein